MHSNKTELIRRQSEALKKATDLNQIPEGLEKERETIELFNGVVDRKFKSLMKIELYHLPLAAFLLSFMSAYIATGKTPFMVLGAVTYLTGYGTMYILRKRVEKRFNDEKEDLYNGLQKESEKEREEKEKK